MNGKHPRKRIAMERWMLKLPNGSGRHVMINEQTGDQHGVREAGVKGVVAAKLRGWTQRMDVLAHDTCLNSKHRKKGKERKK